MNLFGVVENTFHHACACQPEFEIGALDRRVTSGDVNVQNSWSTSDRPRRAIVAAAPTLLASLALHGAGTTSQIDGTTGAQAKLLAARKDLGVEDGWRDSDRCGDLQRYNIPVGAMRKYCLLSTLMDRVAEDELVYDFSRRPVA
jgi:hypothetical protein